MEKYIKLSIAKAINQASPAPEFQLSEAQIEKLKTYSQILLSILTVLGIATMTVLAPNALQALDIFQKRKGKKRFPPKERQRKLARSFYYLRERGQVEFRRKGEDYEVVLTDRGKKMFRKLRLESLVIPKPAKWDGYFWQVAADIPTKKYRRAADALRGKLKELGFFSLQRTLWFYPFDPRPELEFVSSYYAIDAFVTTMKISVLDPSDKRRLERHFKQVGII